MKKINILILMLCFIFSLSVQAKDCKFAKSKYQHCDVTNFKKLERNGIMPIVNENYYIIKLFSKADKEYLGEIIIDKEGEINFKTAENEVIEELKNSILDFGAIKIETGGYNGGIRWHGVLFAPQYSDYFIPAIELFLKRRDLIVKSSFVQ